MTFFQSIATCLRRFATFRGRATPAEFWPFFTVAVALLILVNIFFALLVAAGRIAPVESASQAQDVASALLFVDIVRVGISVVILIPLLAAGCRRLHDVGRSGWWQLLNLACCVGTIVLLVWWSQPTAGANRYGSGPPGSSA